MLLKSFLLIILCQSALASYVDSSPPADANGNWQVDLYNASGVERGTLGVPLRFDPTGTTPQPASQSGTWTTGRTWTLLNTTDSVNSVQSGAWTTGRTWSLLNTTDSVNVGNFPSVQPVSQSGAFNITNITGTVSLPTGASTSALQTTGNASLSSIDGKTPALGQATMTASVPVVIASNQTAIPVTQSGTFTTGRTWTLANTTDSVAAVQSGAWTVTANAGTNLNTSALALDTSVNGVLVGQGSSTSGQKGPLVQGAVTSSLPTYTAGQTSPLSLTTSGALRTDASATVQPVSQNGAPWSQNITQVLGSAPSSTNGLATRITNGTSFVDPTQIRALTTSDAVTATQGGAWSTGRTWTLGSGTDSVSAVQSGSWTVTANAGTNLNTSLLALDTSVNGILLAQGSTTSGQKGPLIQGAVSTSSPTLTTGQTSPLSLTTAGGLRTDGSGVTQPISAVALPLPAGASTAAGLTQINTTLGTPFQAGGSIGNTTFASTQSGTWNVGLNAGTNNIGSLTNITGTITLPTGAATSALQTSGNSTLTTISGQLPTTLGAKTAANSFSVALATDQTVSTKTPLTPNAPTTVSVGVASGVVLAANASRKGLVLFNNSTATISFGLGATAVLGSGITLYPGGVWYMDEFTFTTGAINGIASAAASALSVQEFQ